MRYLDKLRESAAKKEKLSPKQHRTMMTAVERVRSVEGETSGSKPSDAFIRGVKKGAKGEILRRHERKKKEALRKKEEEATNEARTIPKQKGGGYSKKTTSSDRRVSPTEKSLEGEGLSRAEYRKRMMKKLKAESYIQLGDILAEAMLGEARVNKKIEKATRAGTNYLTGNRRDDQTPETLKGRFLKTGEDLTAGQKRAMHKEAEAMKKKNKKKRVVKKLKTSADEAYRDAEVGEASGESAESVKKKSAKAYRRMKKAHDIEDKGKG